MVLITFFTGLQKIAYDKVGNNFGILLRFSTYAKFSEKLNISYPLIRTVT